MSERTAAVSGIREGADAAGGAGVAGPDAGHRAAVIIQRSDLPASLGTLVHDTVRRTRLRPREQAEIARELIAHFREGLDRGAEPARLAADFGSPRAVAPLIRASARRKRSRLDRLLGRTLVWGGGGLAALLVVYVALSVRLHVMEPAISVDGFERLQATMPLAAPGQAAWPRYRAALTWHRQLRLAPDPVVIGAAIRAEDATTADAARDFLVLSSREKELAALREAAALPALGWTIGPDLSSADAAWFGDPPRIFPELPETMLVHAQLPYVGELREAAMLLAADARRVIATLADGERAVDNLLAMVGIAGHVGELPVIITQLVQAAILDAVASEVVHVLKWDAATLSTPQLERLADGLAAIDPAAWRLDLTGERLWLHDVVQHLYSDDGSGDGVLLPGEAATLRQLLTPIEGTATRTDPVPSPTAFRVGAPLIAGIAAGRRETLELADELYGLIEAEADLPLSERTHELGAALADLRDSAVARYRHPVVATLMPAVGRASDRLAEARGSVDGALVALRLEQWRREHGAWPDRLEQLVPTLLPAIPTDPWDGQPLRYRAGPDGPRLWSVGPDGADDGGLMAVDPTTGEAVRRPSRWNETAADTILFDGRSGRAPD